MPKKMLILRGIQNLLHEGPAKEYARRRGYVGEVLNVSGEAYNGSPQVRAAVDAIEGDDSICALYGFSGGGYNAHHILSSLDKAELARIELVVILGAPHNPAALYKGAWELVYRNDPPAGHMAGPDALLKELGPEPAPAPEPAPRPAPAPPPPDPPRTSGLLASGLAAIGKLFRR